MAKNNQHARLLDYKSFDLVKFKTLGDDTDVHYYDTSNSKLGKQTAEIKEKLHEDLLNKLAELKHYFADRLGLLEVTDDFRDKFKDKPEVLEYAVKLHKLEIDRCSVTGITFSGDKQLKKVQITGKVKVPGYGSFSLACPGINLVGDSLGYEEDVIAICEEIRKEVYQHAFNGKRAPKPTDNQMDIEDAIEEANGKYLK